MPQGHFSKILFSGYSSGGDSAFPVPTPDRLGTLADLLEDEETIVLPGESGREETTQTSSASTRGKKKRGGSNWAYMQPPRSPTTSTTSSDISRVSQ